MFMFYMFLCVNLKLILDNNLSLRNNPTVVREVKLTLYQHIEECKPSTVLHYSTTRITRDEHTRLQFVRRYDNLRVQT